MKCAAAIRFTLIAALSVCTAMLTPAAELWSLKPLQNFGAPSVKNDQLCRTPVDQFILRGLESAGLTLNLEADRRTLIRRLTFDLLGLPPSPEEIDAFLTDPSPAAYEKLVERLLTSPHYGERWGRHWLDVARYTESQGFEYDHLRANGWQYRDYVIDAFNTDRPYDRFVQEQIAGDILDPESPACLIATSLLVCGPYDQAGNAQANATQKAISREDELEDLVSTVAQGVLGLTVNCARCHSHKFDPIPQTDYYRMKAVFQGVRHGEAPIVPKSQARKREADIARIKEQFSDQKEREAAIQKLKPLPVSYTGVREQPAPTHLLKRGDVKSPLEEVRPGGLSALTNLSSDFGLAPDAPEGERRLRFARWLTDCRNPLTARVIANRVWLYHFGQGLASNPSDFGQNGGHPAHPELLDWLANYLIQNDWSIKALHRIILYSAAYRQSSAFNPRAAEKDSDNTLLWRFKPRRLEAEAVRDALLTIGGTINSQIGGPSFRPFDIVTFNSSSYFPKDVTGAEYDRRTVYRANVNSGKDPLLDTLDCPDPSVRTPKRMTTITPLQALSLMNNPFVVRQSERLAARIHAETKTNDAAIERVYLSVLGRKPTRGESIEMSQHFSEPGLANVCWVLFNSTEFMYVQ